MYSSWIHSPETDALRLLRTAHHIANGFFRVNGFCVLPLELRSANSSGPEVFFPDLPYHKISRFWPQVERLRWDQEPEGKLMQGVVSLLEGNPLPQPDYRAVQARWAQAQGEVIAEIERIMPSKKNAVSELIIWPSTFGTSSTFYPLKSYPGPVKIHLRDDQGTLSITEAILTCITRLELEERLSGLWQESEILVDWLLTESSLRPILEKHEPETNFVPTTNRVRAKQAAHLIKQSEEFYERLGLRVAKRPEFIILNSEENDSQIFFGEKALQDLTQREGEILARLIQNGLTGVSYDELADIMFEEYDDFSLYAISKAIQRLRDKLEENGVTGSHVQTMRGVGYVLRG